MQIDMRVAELLASRLCHDVVGPVGAVNHGMELLEDEGAAFGEDALRLASTSARHAADLLQYYRLAYGAAGSQIEVDWNQVRTLCQGYLARSKVSLAWSGDFASHERPAGLGKLVLNLVALAAEALPRGGSIAVACAAREGALRLEATAAGRDAAVREECVAALAEDCRAEDLTPRNVQGYFTKLLVHRLGGRLESHHPSADTVRLSAVIPL